MAGLVERPTPRFDWFIPIDGDGAHIGTLQAERPPTFDNLKQIVLAAEQRGFYSLLIPTRFANGLFDETAPLAETWTMVTALAAVTSRIRFLIAIRPGFISPGLFAKMAATLSELSGGRIDLNVVPGGIQGDFERFGEMSDHDTRYERAEEFIAALRTVWATPQPVVYEGRFIHFNGAICSPGPVGAGLQFYLGGASPAALELAGRQSDVYLGWIQPRGDVAAHLDRARLAFAKAERPAGFGLRSHLIVRDTEAAAWTAADDLLSQADEQVKAQRRAIFAGTPMVGQQAQAQVVEQHRLDRHLWNGISTVRVNCGSALVGTPEQIAQELLGYWRLGIDEFILSGYPHLEECHRTADTLIPLTQELIERER